MTRAQTTAVMFACIVTLLLGILDISIVTTTGTAIVGDLGGAGSIGQVPWLVAIYAVVATIVQPLYGKLADAFGPRRVYLGTTGAFIVGSALCAAATSVPELLAFRAVQGVGGGGLVSVTIVVFGHLRAEDPDSARANAGNSVAGIMVGLGVVCGPLLGGALVAHASWRWIFLINLPLSVAAWLTVAALLRLDAPRGETGLDLPGAAILAAAATALLVACEWGGQRYAWSSVRVIGLLAVGASLGAAFVRRQMTSRAPLFPARLLRLRLLRVIAALQVATGCGLAAGALYVTLDLQLVHGISPMRTGLMLVPMAIGLAAGATAGSVVLARGRPLRTSLIAGTAVAAVALVGLALTQARTPMAISLTMIFVLGVGVGLGMGNEVILVQRSVERRDLGVATTGIRFVETMGTSVGAAVFATIFAGTHQRAAGADPAHVMGALRVIFAVGAAVLAAAAVVATRLPDEPAPAVAQPGPAPGVGSERQLCRLEADTSTE